MYNLKDQVRMQFIKPTDDDDPGFLALVSRLLTSSIRQTHPTDVFLVRIDQWFDHKWFAFAGKIYGKVAIRKSQRLTIPPFIPGRVVSQHVYTLDGDVYRKRQAPSLHRYQHSGENLSRFIGHTTESGVFLWFSGDTVRNEHGSVMLYAIQGEMQSGWYASFRRGADWQLFKAKGISRAELMRMIESEIAA